MKISASIKNSFNLNQITVKTNDASKELNISSKASGYESSINGGELLLLALATCFCNDIYREARKRNINITNVEVVCTGDFGAEGEPGFNFKYKTKVIADASDLEIEELIRHTDRIAEIHNTLRRGIEVTLES